MRRFKQVIKGSVLFGMGLGALQAGQTLNIGNTVSIVNGVTIVNGKPVSGANSNHVQDAGKITEEKRTLESFKAIDVGITADINITQGAKAACTLRGDANILANITTEVRGGTLQISAAKGFSTQSSLRIDIVAPKLDALVADASGNTVIENLDGADLQLRLNGSGNITASGRVNSLKADLQGAGDMNLFALEAQTVEARLDGSGDIKVHAVKQFSGVVDGSGDIVIQGNPKLGRTQINGAGDIVRR